MKASQSSKELIKNAIAGSEAAWAELYHLYYPPLYAIALRICGNIPAAKDAVQETFMITFLRLSQLKDPGAFEAWLRKILVNNCTRLSGTNKMNEWKNSITIEQDSFWEDEMNFKLEKIAEQNQLYSTIATLPETLRSALLLRYYSGFPSYEDIATILSVPVGTIRSRLNQAKVKLAENWKQYKGHCKPAIKADEEWNQFYYTSFKGMHRHDEYKNQFLEHLQNDVEIIFPGKKINKGSWLLDKEVNEDRQVGSWFTPTNVQTCGNITIVEARHFNSPEYPNHCPDSTVCVLYRDKSKVNKINLYQSPR